MRYPCISILWSLTFIIVSCSGQVYAENGEIESTYCIATDPYEWIFKDFMLADDPDNAVNCPYTENPWEIVTTHNSEKVAHRHLAPGVHNFTAAQKTRINTFWERQVYGPPFPAADWDRVDDATARYSCHSFALQETTTYIENGLLGVQRILANDYDPYFGTLEDLVKGDILAEFKYGYVTHTRRVDVAAPLAILEKNGGYGVYRLRNQSIEDYVKYRRKS